MAVRQINIPNDYAGEPFEVDVRADQSLFKDGDDDAGIGVEIHRDKRVLVLGNLKIVMTEDQEEELRYYYENT